MALQKEIGRQGCIVMDGRDIGTVVMPDADWKIFLQASVEERARRRQKELQRNGHAVDLVELEEQIRQRDHSDSTREVSPLRKAEDAIEVDTTHMNIEQVVDKVLAIIKGQTRMYRLVRLVARSILLVLFGLEVSGLEHVPKEGGAIIAGNHATLMDPVAIGAAIKRPVHFYG